MECMLPGFRRPWLASLYFASSEKHDDHQDSGSGHGPPPPCPKEEARTRSGQEASPLNVPLLLSVQTLEARLCSLSLWEWAEMASQSIRSRARKGHSCSEKHCPVPKMLFGLKPRYKMTVLCQWQMAHTARDRQGIAFICGASNPLVLSGDATGELQTTVITLKESSLLNV